MGSLALIYVQSQEIKKLSSTIALTKHRLDVYIPIDEQETAEIKKLIDRSFTDLSKALENLKVRIEGRPQAEKWTSLREAFKSPVKSVEINERSGTF